MKQIIENIINNLKIPIRMFFISLLTPFISFVIMTIAGYGIIGVIFGVLLYIAPVISLFGFVLGIIQIIKFRDYYEHRGSIIKGLVGNFFLLIIQIMFVIMVLYIAPLV